MPRARAINGHRFNPYPPRIQMRDIAIEEPYGDEDYEPRMWCGTPEATKKNTSTQLGYIKKRLQTYAIEERSLIQYTEALERLQFEGNALLQQASNLSEEWCRIAETLKAEKEDTEQQLEAVQRRVECLFCTSMYNSHHHKALALPCGHLMCSSCMETRTGLLDRDSEHDTCGICRAAYFVGGVRHRRPIDEYPRIRQLES